MKHEKIYDPIVIIGTPRSFTSLTSGIFRDHGVWFGQCREYTRFAPTGSCENQRMKTELKRNFGGPGIVKKGKKAPELPGWKEFIEELQKQQGYEGGPHAYKHSAMFYPTWHEFNARFVCCRRNKKAVIESGKRAGMSAVESWDAHQDAMDEVVAAGKGVDVHGDRYFEGDWRELKKAFEFCDLKFNKKIAENLIDHKHKHF